MNEEEVDVEKVGGYIIIVIVVVAELSLHPINFFFFTGMESSTY